MHTYPHTYQNVKTIFQNDTAWVKKVSRVTLPKGLSPPPSKKQNKTQVVKMGISIYRGRETWTMCSCLGGKSICT